MPACGLIVEIFRSSDRPAFTSLTTASLFRPCCAMSKGQRATNNIATKDLRTTFLLGFRCDERRALGEHRNHLPKGCFLQGKTWLRWGAGMEPLSLRQNC